MKVLVCGGRKFNDRDFVYRVLDRQHRVIAFSHVIHGACSGADMIADAWATSRGVQPVACKALWDYYRDRGRLRSAEPIRNQLMIALEPSLVIAFPGGDGTQGMIDLAISKDIQVITPTYDDQIYRTAVTE